MLFRSVKITATSTGKVPNTSATAASAGADLNGMAAMNAARTKTSTPPGEYMRRLYYDSVTYRSDALQMCIDVGGADRVMYGSDYPHNIGDMKGCLARVDALPAGHVKAVRSANAERIFRL